MERGPGLAEFAQRPRARGHRGVAGRRHGRRGRSGDKGDSANIGIIARSPEAYAVLCDQLTAERVHAYFAHLVLGEVRRYPLPGCLALNFVMTQALGGGGVASLRYDPQGKAFAQMLLDLEVDVPAAVLESLP